MLSRRHARASIERALARVPGASTCAAFEVWRARDASSEWASNAALKCRLDAAQRALLLSQLERDARESGLAWRVWIKRGFVNFGMNDTEQNRVLERARQEGESFGRGEVLGGERVNVEWVSADPDGPLSASAARIAVAGEALCRILEASGARGVLAARAGRRAVVAEGEPVGSGRALRCVDK